MSVHTIHPDSHTDGLADSCGRCMEHATRPFDSLDDENLSILIRRCMEHAEPRSVAERVAMDKMRHYLRIADRIGRLTRALMAVDADG